MTPTDPTRDPKEALGRDLEEDPVTVTKHTGEFDCGPCGGGECGLHPAGCTYGGPTEATGYWLVADGCELSHD